MKKLVSLCMLISMAVALMAAPARREPITLTQPDGTKIQALLWGDEFMSMVTELNTGKCLIQDESNHFWRLMTDLEVKETTLQWSDSRRKAMAANVRYKIGGVPKRGQIHMPVLLVQFPDLKFSERYGSVAYFDSVFNRMDYDRIAFTSTNGIEYHTGSVRSYFNTQSHGKFDFQADIIGPITLDSSYVYYGKNSGSTKDVNYSRFLSEAIQKAFKGGYIEDASKYVGNRKDTIDFIYIVYAGWGENENGITNYIWAKNSYPNILIDNRFRITNISSSCELTSERNSKGDMVTVESPDGIGVLVHEFSHALSLPDFYSTKSDGSGLYQRYGMDGWSVMDQGNYSGKGQIPGSYTAHERMHLGWIDSTQLKTVPAVGRDTLPPFASSGKAMILYNPANANEYITLENHYHNDNKNNLWESCWGNSSMFTYKINQGMLITHVDYVRSYWDGNIVNNNSLHQYCSPLPADGELWAYEAMANEADRLANIDSLDAAKTLVAKWRLSYRADIFPGYNNVTTLNGSNPKAKWYTGDTMAINITNIRQLADGSLELTFGDYVEPDPIINAPASLAFGLNWGPTGTQVKRTFAITTEHLKEAIVPTLKKGKKYSVEADTVKNSYVVSLNEPSTENEQDTLTLTSGIASAQVALSGVIVATQQDGKSEESTLTADEVAAIGHAGITVVKSFTTTDDSVYIYGIVDSVMTVTDGKQSFYMAGAEQANLFLVSDMKLPMGIDSIQVADTVILQTQIMFIDGQAMDYNGQLVSHRPYIAPVGIETISVAPSPSPRKVMTKEKRIIVNGYDLLGRKVK